MPAPYSVVVADDSTLFLEAVARAVDALDELEVVGRALDGDAALAAIRELRPDIALLDVHMPGASGGDVSLRIREEGLPTSCVLMSTLSEEELALQSARTGAASFVDKSRKPEFIAQVALHIARRWDGLR